MVSQVRLWMCGVVVGTSLCWTGAARGQFRQQIPAIHPSPPAVRAPQGMQPFGQANNSPAAAGQPSSPAGKQGGTSNPFSSLTNPLVPGANPGYFPPASPGALGQANGGMPMIYANPSAMYNHPLLANPYLTNPYVGNPYLSNPYLGYNTGVGYPTLPGYWPALPQAYPGWGLGNPGMAPVVGMTGYPAMPGFIAPGMMNPAAFPAMNFPGPNPLAVPLIPGVNR